MGAAETGAAPIPSDTGRKLNKHVGAKYVDQVLDSLYVIEKAMRHFFLRAETGKAVGRGQQQVDENFRQAAALAALAAPGISPTSIACPANATGTESGNGGRTGPFARKARRCIDSRANGVRSWRSSNRLPTRL